MIKVLLAPTEDFIKQQRTSLSLDVNAGSNAVLTVPNTDGYAIGEFICVGFDGADGAELCKITNLSATSLTVLTLVLAHKSGEAITKYRYDKRKFYGSETADGSYTELTGDGSPKTIQVGDPQGTMIEYTGSEYTYFKSTYYNSATAEETSTDDANATLADETKRYCSIYAIRKQAGLTNNPFINDGLVETYRKRAESEVKSIIMSRYILPLPVVPGIIENATVLLAAGYMDYQEFGKDGEGVKWLGEARGILNSIKKGNQRLLDPDTDEELPYNANSSQITSNPQNSDGRKFTMDKVF